MFKTILLFCTLVVIALAESESKCSTELQEIVFEPEIYAKQYLSKVAAAFNRGKALLFTPQATDYINSFQQEWGVNIAVADPTSICTVGSQSICSSTIVAGLSSDADRIYSLPITESYRISALNITVVGTTTGGNGLGAYTLKSPANTLISLSSSNICEGFGGTGIFIVGFSDSSTATFDCANINQRQSIAPSQPLSAFNGEGTQGTWTLTLTGPIGITVVAVRFSYCQSSQSACPRDVMRSVLNVPGFRIDSGVVYYTEDVFDSFGSFKQVTISRPIDGLYLKK